MAPTLTLDELAGAEYASEWAAEGTVRLNAGTYEEEIVPGAATKLTIRLLADAVAFGDLNGDGAVDAAVVLATDGGGSGTFLSLAAVLNEGGEPRHVAAAALGDRQHVESLSIADGVITLEALTHGPDDPQCCPTVKATRKLRLTGERLVDLPVES